MTTTKLRPKRQPTAGTDAFTRPLDIQKDDRIHFLGNGKIKVMRGDRLVCHAYCHDFGPDSKPVTLRKKAGDSKYGPIPPNSRWITVHPGGDDGPGVPVLIRPDPDGKGASVIGGAGGKLNQLRLTNLKSPEEWKEKSRLRKKKKQEADAALPEEEKQQKTKARDEVKEQTRSAKHANALQTLESLDKHGIAHGLTDEHRQALQQELDPDADPQEVKRQQQLAKEAVAKVRDIHRQYEYELIGNHEMRSAAILGDAPLSDEGNQVVENKPHTAANTEGREIASLQQLPDGKWAARSANEGAEQQIFDNWAEAARAHVANVLEAEQESGGDRTQPDSFYSPAQWVRTPSSDVSGIEFKPEAALEIARLSADRKASDKAARAADKEIEKGDYNVAGLTARAQEITDQEVISKLQQEAKTLEDATINSAFLNLADEVGDMGKLKRHLQVGGYGKLAEIASDVLKQNTVSRQLVDLVGHNEAAKILAHQIRSALTPAEYDRVVAAQAAYHADTSTRIARATTERVKPQLETLRQLHQELLMVQEFAGDSPSPEEQIQIDGLAYDIEQLHKGIEQSIGTTLGQLQASAAMVAALESNAKSLRFVGDAAKALSGKVPEMYEGDMDPEDTPSVLSSHGLTADDFKLFDSADGEVLQINESGLQKLAVGYNPEDKEAYDRAVAIKRGDFDEEDYTPTGFSYYAKSSFTDAQTESEQFDTDFPLLKQLASASEPQTLSLFGEPEPSENDVSDQDVEDGLRGYIGARVANGENPLDVMNDVRSPDFYAQQGLDPYGESALRVQGIASDLVKRVAGGDRISDKAIISAFQQLGDDEAAKQRKARQTDDLQSLHAQTLQDEDSAVEALHRSLAVMPQAKVALKDWKDTTSRERKWLRQYAITEVLGQALDPPKPKKQLGADVPSEVAEEQFDLFGNKISAAEALGQEDEPEELSQWEKFSKIMGGDAKAYEAVRDHLRGKFMHRVANAYGAIAGKPPLIGGQNLQNIEKLMLAKLPEDQRNEMLEFMRAREKSDVPKVRRRSGGKFAAEIDPDWLAKYEEIKGDNRQISLLSSDSGRSTPKTDYQRTTLGTAAEAQLQELAKRVLPNFEQLDSSVDIIPEVNWSKGTAHATKQRALKFIEAQKRVGIWHSAGSGKTALALGTFTHLHSQGKVKKAVVCVPSAIVGQVIGEAVSFLKPGTYNYNANLGMSREDRIKSLLDSNLSIHVTTRESLANDLLHLVEKHHGISGDDYRRDVGQVDEQGNPLPGHTEADRQRLMKEALLAEGINPDDLMLVVDEAHDLLVSGSQDASRRSVALNTLGHHTPYYVQMTGSPIKNNLEEAYNFLHSIAPDKFSDKKKFLSEYGGNTTASRRALQRAIAPYTFAAGTKPKDKQGRMLKMHEEQPKITVSEHLAQKRQEILDHVSILSNWQRQHREKLKEEKGEDYRPTADDFNAAWNDPDVREAVEKLGSEDTWGKMSDEEKQGAIGRQVMAMGALKMSAMNRLFNLTEYENNPKAQWTVNLAKKMKAEGKAGVVFSTSSRGAAMLKEAMEKQGLKVGLLDGSLNSEQKSKIRNEFQTEGLYDVLVATDCARTGANLTRGKYLVHQDCPMTQMAYEQRSARIFRLKQDQNVKVYVPQLDLPDEQISWGRVRRKAEIAAPLQAKSELIDDSGLAARIEQMRNTPKVA